MPICASYYICTEVCCCCSAVQKPGCSSFSWPLSPFICLSVVITHCWPLCCCLLRLGSDNWLCTVGVRPKKVRQKGKKLLRLKKHSAAQSAMLPTSPLEKSLRVMCPLYTSEIPLILLMAYFHSSLVSLQPISLSFHMETPQPLSHWPTLLPVTPQCLIRRLWWSWRKLEVFVSFVCWLRFIIRLLAQQPVPGAPPLFYWLLHAHSSLPHRKCRVPTIQG